VKLRTLLPVCIMNLALVLAACSSQPSHPPASYKVRSGETLYSIATRYGLDYRELARLNGIGNDYRIYVGQVLRLPNRALPNKIVPAKPASAPQTAMPPPSYIVWRWPADAVSYAATQRPNGGRGLTINGRLGQEVRAAANGKVVYTGSGLLGYGQLVIVKHDETYLSAYGHLQSVLVHEGDQVSADQKVATMGAGPSGTPLLYFEIRVNGQPVDPLPLLPQQR